MCPKLDNTEYDWEKDLKSLNEVDKSFTDKAKEEIEKYFDDESEAPEVKALSRVKKMQALSKAIKDMEALAGKKLKKEIEEQILPNTQGMPKTAPPQPPSGIPMPPSGIPKPPGAIPQPPGNMPPPFPGEIPPPFPGAMGTKPKIVKAPVKKFSEYTSSERTAWINKLQQGNSYPQDEELLSRLGINPLKAGKPFDDPKIEERIKTELRSQLETFWKEIDEVSKVDSKSTEALLQYANNNATKSWSGANGLGNAYDYLRKQIVKIREKAEEIKAKEKMEQENDPEYVKAKTESKTLLERFDLLAKEYISDTTPSERREHLYSEMSEISKKLEQARNKIQDFKAAVAENKQALKDVNAQRKRRMEINEPEIKRLSEEIAPYVGEDISEAIRQEFGPLVEKNTAEIKRLRDEQNNPSQSVIEEEQAKLAEIKQKIQSSEQKAGRARILRAFYNDPPAWKQVNDLKRKFESKSTGPKAKGSTKGMEPSDEGKREIDLSFLNATQLQRLARFFAASVGDFQDYTQKDNKEAFRQLTIRVNGALKMNEAIDFDVLMDIAEGKLSRIPQKYAPQLQQLLYDEHVVRTGPPLTEDNYNHLLKRKDDFKNEKLNQGRGISIKKIGKYFEHYRVMDSISKFNPESGKLEEAHPLSYMNDEQLQRLVTFFARSPQDLRSEGKIDGEALSTRINSHLRNTAITFEDIADIAAGNLSRKSNQLAPANLQNWLENTQRNPSPPKLYEDITKQRSTYITQQQVTFEKAKAEAEKKAEEEKIRKEQETAEKLKAAQEKYSKEASELLEQYKGEFKEEMELTNLNLGNPRQFKAFEGFVNEKVAEMAQELKSVILEQMKSMDPLSYKEVEKKEDEPALDTKKSVSTEEVKINAPEDLASEEVKISSDKPNTDEANITASSPKTNLASDPYALKIIRDVLKRIDVQQNYELATREKRGLKGTLTARYKVFQHGDRPQQIVSLQKTIIKAQEDIDALIKLYARAQVNPDEAKNAMARIFDGLEHTMQDIEEQMEAAGHKKKGTSRMENVIKDLRDQFNELQTGLGLEVKKPVPKSPTDESTKKRSTH